MLKKTILFFFGVFLMCSLSLPAFHGAEAARGKNNAKKRTESQQDAAAPKDAAHSGTKAAGKNTGSDAVIHANSREAILMEVYSGQTLFEQDADARIEPASFTKVLTLYLVFEALQQGLIHMEDEVYISKEAWATGGSKMFVDVGSKVPVEELIKGIAVVSGNDACVAMAEHLNGSVDAFVAAMNNKAQELGMTNSHFMNPHGLPADGQITSARDMAKLGVSYLQRFPESLRFHSMREYSYNNINQGNRNRLLFKDETVDGLKTGFVTAGGYHLAATSQKEGMRLLAVVMGAENPHVREVEALKLLSYGFHHYALLQPFTPNDAVTNIKVWKGEKDSLDLYPADRVNLLVPRAQKNSVKWEVHAPQDITAPVQMRQEMGDVTLLLDGVPKKTVPLMAKEEIPRAGFFKRCWHTILQIHKINWLLVGGIAGGIILVLLLAFLLLNRRPATRRVRPRGL